MSEQQIESFLAPYVPKAGKWLTLSFAQSQDGKIADAGKKPVKISGDAMRLGRSLGNNPRPVVLDDQLLTPLSSRLLQNFSDAKGSAPLLLAAIPNHAADLSEWHRRREQLIHTGAEVCLIEADENGNLTWSAICAKLQELHLDSVMVEGGATVIDSILRANTAQPGIIQSAIVTISPRIIGPQGVGYETELPLEGGKGSGLMFDADGQFGGDRVAALKGT